MEQSIGDNELVPPCVDQPKQLEACTTEETPVTSGEVCNGHSSNSAEIIDLPAQLPARGGIANAAVSAALHAAQHAAPAQRERLMQEAAAKAVAARIAQEASRKQRASAEEHEQQGANGAEAAALKQEAPTAAAAKAAAPGYQPPNWAAAPAGVPFQLEVMKNGTIIAQHDVADKDHYTFGRAPNNDFVLDHPSSSRLHAVIQYKGPSGGAFLWDPHSTHGVIINKKRIPAGEYVPLRVGDVIKFGQSSRLHIFSGPADLMPEEGPSKEQRKQADMLKAAEARRAKEAEVSRQQMQSALQGEVTWGMAEDAEEEDFDEHADLDWRRYRDTKGLSEKQQKTAAKIEGREQRIKHLQQELDRIRAKEQAMEDLTPGQLNVLVRNGQEIDRLTAELEDMEESLLDSIRDAIGARKRTAAGQEKKKEGNKRKAKESDDAEALSSDDDAFYDRSKAGVRKRMRQQQEAQTLDAATLMGQKQALEEERKRLQEELAQERATTGTGAPAAGPGPSQGPGRSSNDNEVAEEQDALDAFMSSMEQQIHVDKAGALKREIQDLDVRLAETERLLKIADPSGYYKPGSAAAAAATRKAALALELERKKKEAEERRKRQQEAEAQAAAQGFVPEEEVEEQEDEHAAAAAPAPTSRPSGTAAAPSPQETAGAAGAAAAAPEAPHVLPASAAHQQLAGLEVRRQEAAAEASEGKGPRKPTREEIAHKLAQQKRAAPGASAHDAAAAAEAAQAAQAKVMADLALLSGRRASEQDDGVKDVTEEAGNKEWQPPQGQTGDGRTKLNDLLGY